MVLGWKKCLYLELWMIQSKTFRNEHWKPKPPLWLFVIQKVWIYHIYPNYSDTSTPYHICSKIWTSTTYYSIFYLKIAEWVATISVDPGETNTAECSISSGSTLFTAGLYVRIHMVNRAFFLSSHKNTCFGHSISSSSRARSTPLSTNDIYFYGEIRKINRWLLLIWRCASCQNIFNGSLVPALLAKMLPSPVWWSCCVHGCIICWSWA